MSEEELATRVGRMEVQLRRTQGVLTILVVVLLGVLALQRLGVTPLKGSSLQIEEDGRTVLDVRRVHGHASLFLYDETGEASVSLIAGGAGPSFHLTHENGQGGVLLSAGPQRASAVLSTAPDGERLFLSVGFRGPELQVLDSEGSTPRPPRMPRAELTSP